MIKVELLKSIAPKQEVSRAKSSESRTPFKDVLTRETKKVNNNNINNETNITNKNKEKTNIEEKNKNTTKTTTSITDDKKIQENKQKTNIDDKQTKSDNKKKKAQANNTENHQQIAFIDVKHITAKEKVSDKTNSENKKTNGKKIEVLSADTKNKNIKLRKNINSNIKTEIPAHVANAKEKEKDNKNITFLKDTPVTNKEKMGDGSKNKHIKLINLTKNTENLKEHKNDKVKQISISVEAKQTKTSSIKKETKTNHIVETNSIKDGETEDKNIKAKYAKDTKLHAQTEKKHEQKQGLNSDKEKFPKKTNLIVEDNTTQKVAEKKTENTKIKHIDTKNLEKSNDRNNVEILRNTNNKDTKTVLNNTTKLENNNNHTNTIQNLESKQNIEIRPEKIEKTSSENVKNKKGKKTLKVDTKKQHTINIGKDLIQNVQEKDINSQNNHQQNLTLHSKENMEFSKKLKNTQKTTFINEIKDKAINHENSVQQTNNTHLYATNAQTNSINQSQQVQTNQTNLHPPLDKVIKEIDKISNLKPPVTKSITLKLNPPNLGNLHLKVSLDAQKNLTASIAVHDKNTYKTIVNHIDSLKEYLVTNGIKVQNIDVHNSFNENFMNQFSNGSSNFQQQGQTNGNQTSSGFNYNNFDGETVQKESRIITQSRRVSGIDINA